jgi:exopolysaccharide biosynthesis WecB/TagA/CpsF family protein
MPHDGREYYVIAEDGRGYGMKVEDGNALVDVGGLGLSPLTEADVVAHVRAAWRAGGGGTIVTANVDILRAVIRDRSLAELVAGASLVVADGMPLVWASRLMGEPLPQRVAGSSLVFSLSEAAAEDGRSIFMLGGDPGVPEAAGCALQSRFPGLRVVGSAAPPVGFEETEHGMAELVRAVTAAAPDLVFVGLGFPKQERTIQRLRTALPDAWYLGCGAGIPMAAGQFRRAPVAVQRLGMEWLYRLALEPRRLARRYLRDDLPFAFTLLSGALRRRLAARRTRRAIADAPSAQPGQAGESRPLAVVIVTYASAEVIADCLTALPAALAGTVATRVVVVDNASPDNTTEIVARTAPHAEIVRRAGNDGFAAGVNAGLAATAGCDVLVLNPDVRLAPGCVAPLREALAQPGTGITVPRLTDADGVRHHSLRRRPTVLRAFGEAVLGGTRAGRIPALGALVLDPRRYARYGTVDWAVGAAWLISADCVDAVGDLDERYFLYSEETEYMLRAADQGFAVRYQPDALAVHLGGEQSSVPWLWALSVANLVRLHRERHGPAAAALMWLTVLLGETMRLALAGSARRQRHLAGVRELLRMRRWPARPAATTEPAGTTDPDDVCYVCFCAQDWWYHNRAHSDFQLMRCIARHRRVLVVNSIGMRMPVPGRSTHTARRILRKLRSVAMLVRRPIPDLPGFHVMSPLPLPFYGTPWLRRINAVLVRAQVRLVCLLLRLRTPVIVTTLPTAWDVVRPMRRRALVFNRSDLHSEFHELNRDAIESMERELLRAADHVLYVSRSLLAEEQALTGSRAHFLDHGVDLKHFRPCEPAELPVDLAEIPEPRVGFFGAMDEHLVDFDLLERVAAELPDVSLVLIGDATQAMGRFDKYPNVYWLGYRPYEQIPAYGSGFAVALMPRLDNRWNRHSNPIKLKEYLALGLPVVSTDFPEVTHYTDRVRVAATQADFVAAIRATLAGGGVGTPQERRNSVRDSSWQARADTVVELAEGRLTAGHAPAYDGPAAHS